MKRRYLLAACILALMCMLCACGSEESAPTAAPTRPAAQTPTEAVAETAAPTSAPMETQAPTTPEEEAPAETADIDQMIYAFPLLEDICGAKLANVAQDEDGIYELYYENADMDTLETFLYYCSTCGLYKNLRSQEDGMIVYDLYPLGVSLFCRVILGTAENWMIILMENAEHVVTWDDLEAHLAYYEQELYFPAEFGKNVFPQFYATIGEPQPMGRVGSEVDYIFDGGSFWNEWYSDVSYAEARKFVDEMILCGFDVELIAGQTNDDGALIVAVLHFSNGDADVALQYDFEDMTASYYTESGTMWTLLYGEDYARYIPQK